MILSKKLKVVNIGLELFKNEIDMQGIPCVQVNWKPSPVSKEAIRALNKLEKYKKHIDMANMEVIKKINTSQPSLIGMKKAIEAIPNMHSKMILHSGPKIEYDKMAEPMKGAILGAIILENLASNFEDANKIILNNDIEFVPCNEMGAVGPMAGIISPSMPVHIIKNETFGNYAYSNVNEGLGKVLRFGANGEDVIKKLRWICDTFLKIMSKAIEKAKSIDLKNIISQSIQMGDECHNRNKAASALFFKEIVPHIFEVSDYFDKKDILDTIRFIEKNEHYFLNLSMASAKSCLDSAKNINNSTVVLCMARNGVDFGIRLSSNSNKWFVAPANDVDGLLFSGYSKEDCCKDLGDSSITETYGIGGFAMASSPAIVKFVGGTVEDSKRYTSLMKQITVSEHTMLTIPNLDFTGSPMGIDIRKVIDTAILPIINTGIAHKKAGIGQVGAGLVNPPMAVFETAIIDMVKNMT